MLPLVEFLKHVLPNDGYKCWVALKKGERPQQGFTQNFEDLAKVLHAIDAQGWDAYFACAGYKEPVNRKGENVRSAQSFWVDIDYGNIGHSKPSIYPDADSAIAALDRFCDAVQLPYPTVVYSGGGVHAYWALAQELDPNTWVSRANIFKQLCRDHGLDCDPARTSDIASILRAPGTYNWKLAGSPRPVECLEIINERLQFAVQPAVVTPRVAIDPAFYEVGKNAAAIYTNAEPSYASLIANQCAQLRSFRDTRGNISEPLWYAGLGILGHTADGEQLSHEWSKGHPSYSSAETSRKLEQARNASGPSTCQRFRDINPAGCVGCPFTVTSPIVLGRMTKAPDPAVIQAAAIETFPELPKGYGISARYQLTHEVKYKDEAGNDKVISIAFTNHPIYLSEVRDGETERAQGYLFRQWEPDKGWVEFEMPGREFEAMGLWGALAAHGVKIPRKHKQTFIDYIDASYTMHSQKGKKMRYDQLGWKDDGKSFYLAGTLYKNDGTKLHAAGSTEATIRGKKMQPSKFGSLAAWTVAANKLFMEGCEAQSFALLASFAAPLMYFITPQGEGGAILSLLSPGGGTGKSTVLTAIASVWGELDAIRLLSRDTMVAKFRSMGTLCNIPIIFDELRGRHPELITEFVESFTTGRDRLRGRSDGSVNPIEMSWRTILISASNKSLLDALNTKGEDPLSSRVLEVEAKTPKDAEYSLGNELSEELLLNKGYAGRAFIDYLLQPGVLEFCIANIKRLVMHYTQQTHAKPMHRFIIRLLACIAVAGHLVKHMGLLEFSDQRIIEWAMNEIQIVVNGASKFEPIQSLADILNTSAITDCLVVDGSFHPKRQTVIYQKPSRELHMRYEMDSKRLFISAAFMRSKLNEANQPYSLVVNELEKQKILLNRARQTSLAAGTMISGGKTTCWEVDMTHPGIGAMNFKEVLPTEAKAV